jgi:predicted DNA-binding transcriptional regulator YafY
MTSSSLWGGDEDPVIEDGSGPQFLRHCGPMDPTVRALRLLGLLQQRPDWSGAELAERQGVTVRTVRRDVARLRELGYHVDAAPGVDGGYQLRAGSALPPLVLTDEEAVVLAVGLRAATLAGVAGASHTAVSAVAKLEGLLPSRLRARVEALDRAVVGLGGVGGVAVEPSVLALVALACRRGEHLALTYVDARGTRTRRDVQPLHVVQAGRRWYLVAFDAHRDDWRTFRLDRIAAAEPRGGRVAFDDPPDAAALVAASVTAAPYRWTARVRLHLSHDEAVHRVPPTVGRVEQDGATTSLLVLGADDLDWLARYLVGLTCGLEVLEPPELVDALRRLGDRLSDTGPVVAVPPSEPGP